MNDDLACHNGPITGHFAAGGNEDRFALTPGQIAFFSTNGYLAGVRILDNAQIEFLRSELEMLMQPSQAANPLFYEYHHNESSDRSKVLFHALGAWRVSAGFHDLLYHTAFVRPVEQLLNGPARFWHDQLFVKPAHDGGIVAWHQDYSYWTRTKPVAHLTCWIGLDDSTKENGCLQYIAGSHKRGLLPKPVIAAELQGIKDFLNEQQKKQFENTQYVEVKGDQSF